MEEKLYFEPIGDSRKKRTKETSNKKKVFLKLLIFFLFLIGTIVVGYYFLRGTETVSGRFPDDLKNESLECIANNIEYPYTDAVRPESSETKITAIFYGKEEFSSASFKYTMNFKTPYDAGVAESLSHAQFVNVLTPLGFDFGEFNNKFSIIDNKLILTLHTEENVSDEKSGKFFLITKLPEENRIPKSLNEYRKNYELQGFSCKTTLDNN